MKTAIALILVLAAGTPATACKFYERIMLDSEGCADMDRFRRLPLEAQTAIIEREKKESAEREARETMVARATLCMKVPTTETCAPDVNAWIRQRAAAARQ